MAVRWLDDHEQRIWRTFMVATRLLFEQLEREIERNTPVPGPYYEVLVRLSEAPDRRLRMSELADRSQSSRSRLSHTIARLEGEGWVARERCPSDRRGAYATLTDTGLRVLESAAPVHVEGVRTHVFDQLDPGQLEELHRISERLLSHLVSLRGTSPEDLGLLGVLGHSAIATDAPG
jgi:DNA-binding MarR family transcriptional regulator